jgi:hypothetical protein
MKTHKFFALAFSLALLVVPGSALPGSAKPAATLEDTTAAQVAAAPAGNVIQAASCSQTDVQAAVDAASDGDFVLVPAGSCTWTTPLASTPAVEIAGKGITMETNAILDRGIGRSSLSHHRLYLHRTAKRPGHHHGRGNVPGLSHRPLPL